jgi:hypothetical protein
MGTSTNKHRRAIVSTAQTHAEVAAVIEQFVAASSEKYHDVFGKPSLSYPVGYMQSMLTYLLMELPAARRDTMIKQLQEWK